LIPKPGRPKKEEKPKENCAPSTRWKSDITNEKHKCIICQEDLGEKTVQGELLRTGQLDMLEVAKALTDQSFSMRLNAIPNANDAVANDVCSKMLCYNLKCCATI